MLSKTSRTIKTRAGRFGHGGFLGGVLFLQGLDLIVTNLILSLDGLRLYYYNLGDLGEEFEFLNRGPLAAGPEFSTSLLLGGGLARLAMYCIH